jgi:hypothetical protein
MHLRPFRFISVFAATFLGLVLTTTAVATPARAQAHEPILFIHGFNIWDLQNQTVHCEADGRWIWNDMINNFRQSWPDL